MSILRPERDEETTGAVLGMVVLWLVPAATFVGLVVGTGR